MPEAPAKISRFEAEAAALPNSEFKPPVPLDVFLGESLDVARFAQKYWASVKDPLTGAIIRYGLDSAGPKCPASVPQDLLDLHDGAQSAHTEFHLAVDPKSSEDLTTTGQFILREVICMLEWKFDDGVEDADDAALANLATLHEAPDTIDTLASALFDYCTLAKPHAADMDGMGGFKARLIDDGLETAKKLRLLPPSGPANMSDDARRKLDRRNRLMLLLQKRVGLVRGAARFVFRDYPEIIRECTSKYERRKRAAARRAKEAKGTPASATSK